MPRIAHLPALLLAATLSAPVAGIEPIRGIDPQGNAYEQGVAAAEAPRDDIRPEERAKIRQEIEESRARLVAEGRLSPHHAKTITTFAWPLRFAAGRTDFDFHSIGAFVDENPANPGQLLDYACGARTYDVAGYNHQGTDIGAWPFPWTKMDNEDVVIAAGAAGTIVSKSDGNFDRSCAMNNNPWNAVYVQHADGSVAWYGHMKNGSTTRKAVGETVLAGEYLGVVGSSGSSTGPHLHLEIYDAAHALVDPWLGACNAKSKQVTWAKQRPYRDTAVNALVVANALPVTPACPTTETPNAVDNVVHGSQVYAMVYMHDLTQGAPIAVRLLRPDGTVFSSPSATSAADYNSVYYYWSYGNFPNAPGTWTFEATVGGKTVSRTFTVDALPAFGAAASVTTLSGGNQVAAPGAVFAAPLRVQVRDAQARPVKGAKVAFTLPAAGANAVLESRTALTDAAGIASVAARANGTSGAYAITAAVAGVAVPASIALQNAAPVAGGLAATPPVVDFGAQSMNTTSPAQSVTLSNPGGATLTVDAVSASAGFAVTHDCTVLAPGASCSLAITFSPGAAVPASGSVAVQTAAGLQAVGLVGVGEKSLVTHYYRSILRRAPDAPGKAYWESEAARMAAAGANVNEAWYAMAQAFYGSAEYVSFNRDAAGFVTDLYTTFFNRAPDGPGLAFWSGQVAQGVPREVVLSAFMFSAEFGAFTQAIFGDTHVRREIDTVTDFYRGVLGRLPDNGGLSWWVTQFRIAQCQGAAAVTAQAESISSGFATSGEYAGRNRSNAQYVGDLYNAFLRRGGDLAGVQFWIDAIDTNALAREQVRQAFVGSPEFQARVQQVIAQGCLP